MPMAGAERARVTWVTALEDEAPGEVAHEVHRNAEVPRVSDQDALPLLVKRQVRFPQHVAKVTEQPDASLGGCVAREPLVG